MRLLLVLLDLLLLALLLLRLFSFAFGEVSASAFLFLPPYLFLRYLAHELRFSSSEAWLEFVLAASSDLRKCEDRDFASSRPNLNKNELKHFLFSSYQVSI